MLYVHAYTEPLPTGGMPCGDGAGDGDGGAGAGGSGGYAAAAAAAASINVAASAMLAAFKLYSLLNPMHGAALDFREDNVNAKLSKANLGSPSR